jgi:outer membrane protein assembly factor BamA
MCQQLFSKTVIIYLLLFSTHIVSFASAGTDSTTASINTPKDSLPKKVDDIIIIGNKITKPSIILREITFRKGDTLNPADFEKLFKRNENNLSNTSLFNSVHISWLETSPGSVSIYIILKERWYIFPIPIFELVDRNFNAWLRSKDFSRINYGAVVTWNNFRGRNETVGLTLRLGYTQRISFFYSIPFITKKQKSGLSFAFAYSRNHETAYKNFNNDLVYYKDETDYSREEMSGSIQYLYRRNLYHSHLVEAGFKKGEVQDTVVYLNPDFFSYGLREIKYFTLRYMYKIEHRDIVAYPLHGSYFSVDVTKLGFRALQDDIDLIFLSSVYKHYWQLGEKIYFSSALSGKVSGKNFQPYYNTRALGYGSDYLRGYEYYVVDGQKFGLLKTNLKFELIKPHVVHAGFIPIEKFATIPFAFYLNLYGDAGYVQDKQFYQYNSLTNTMLYSGGAGIDFVTFYDLVFRFEYSVNKFGESGIFIHFSAPI